MRFWAITLAALVGVTATVSLGLWQLSRAAQKVALQAAIDAQTPMRPVSTHEVATATDPLLLLHRHARLRGSWAQGHTVFLDNRQMNAKQGFFVVTPLQLSVGGKSILVQRGWVQRNFTDRSQLPQVPTPSGEVEVTGRIAPPPSKLYEFSAAVAGPIRQNLDVVEFRRETHLPLMDISLLQTDAADAGAVDPGLVRDWPQANLGVGKHYGYTFQWWGIAALIATLYVWFQIVRRIRNARHT
jgi:surfeit locus 1 family protein